MRAMTILVLLVAVLAVQSPPQTSSQPAESADAAWTILQNGLTDKNADKRANATHALGLLPHNARAQQLAEKALTDPNADVRTQAAAALGQMGAASSQKRLEEVLKDKDLKVVVSAANSLYIFKNPAAYEIYYALLTGERKGPGLVQSQLDTLKDKKQIEKLMFQTGLGFVPFASMSMDAFKTITHDDVSPVRAAAAEKLVSDPDPRTTEALGQACTDSKWRVRLAVVEAIAKRGDAKLLSSVGPLLYDNNDGVRFEASATVIRLHEQSASRSSRPLRKRGG
jgi:HEAT repeat protein